jgi:2-polyprenyl-3-methyl-5-hydroxy-6-metoxy-1,4-benzoquinol methylase
MAAAASVPPQKQMFRRYIMHTSSMLRMQWFRDNYLNKVDKNKTVTVLDVGSQCVPGQTDTYKVFFNEPPFKYIGLDIAEGYNVDIHVKNAYQWDEVPDNFCDVLISGQMFEHVEFPWFTISEMARVLKPNGIIFIIVPSMCEMHRYPVNCQNYFADGLIALAKYVGLNVIHASTNYAPPKSPAKWYAMWTQDSMLIARKPDDWTIRAFNKVNYICEPADLEKMATGLVPMKKQKCYIKYLIYTCLVNILIKTGTFKTASKIYKKIAKKN